MPGNPLTDPNWAADVTERITSVVGTVRDRTAGTAISVMKGVVFTLLGLFLLVTVLVLLLITLTRGLQALFDLWFAHDKAVWSSYFVLGGILTVAGLLLLSRRQSA